MRRAIVMAALLLTGCASVTPTVDNVKRFVRDDVVRAKEIATAAKDQAGADCADAILAVLPAEGVAALTPIGALSGFMAVREARRKVGGGVDETVHVKCAALILDAEMTLAKLGLMAAPGGNVLGGLLR